MKIIRQSKIDLWLKFDNFFNSTLSVVHSDVLEPDLDTLFELGDCLDDITSEERKNTIDYCKFLLEEQYENMVGFQIIND